MMLARSLAGLLAIMAALLAGLLPSLLRTGRIVPGDWLLPGLLAIAILLLTGGAGGRPVSRRDAGAIWALVVLPLMLFMLVAASRPPWSGLAGLAGGLGLATMALAVLRRRPPAIRWGGLALLLALAAAAQWLLRTPDRPKDHPDGPVVGVMSALPLQGAALAPAGHPLDAPGLDTPLWAVLDRAVRLRPLDALDEARLASVDRLLLAQPRQLAPEELVALDAWVRAGGAAVILADPLLHWPDARPLGDARRAPLTSLLDPLLAHWGLRLEPGRYEPGTDPVERRLLDDGTLLQLAGASRFTATAAPGARCVLSDGGLMARCAIGRGHARLIADADWIHDALWTRDPDHPGLSSAWTSDAVPMLRAWLTGMAWDGDSGSAWLLSENRLISAIRAALALAILLSLGWAWLGRAGMARAGMGRWPQGQIGNIPSPFPDST